MARGAGVLAVLADAATAVTLGWSIWKDVPHTDALMQTEHAQFAGYTRLQRFAPRTR